MIRYSYNLQKTETMAFAQRYNINASYKDLGAVCDAVRYLRADNALALLEEIKSMKTPILYRRHSKHMGARHELGGRKGGYPVKAAEEMRIAILNAIGNAKNGGLSGNDMYIVHASSNKTIIARRYPSKGSLTWGRGMYGRGAMNHSDIEYAKVEIGLANGDEDVLTERMRYLIRTRNREVKKPKVQKASTRKEAAAGESKKEKVKVPI